MDNADSLIAIVQEKIGSRDWEHWKPLFQSWDAPWELVQTVEELVSDPQVLANDMIFDLDVEAQKVRYVAGPVAFDGRVMAADPVPAPGLGAHTNELLDELGYSADVIAQLRSRNIVA